MGRILKKLKDRLTFKTRENCNNTKAVSLIDDNDENLNILKMMLLRKKYEIITAKTQMDGLKIAEKQCPNMIIMNSHIATEKSLELCKKLKNNQGTHQIPILIVEHKRGDSNIAEYYANKIDGYLTFPLDSQELLKQVKELTYGD